MDVELSPFMLKKYVNNICKDLFYKEKLYKGCNKSVFLYFSFSTETNLSLAIREEGEGLRSQAVAALLLQVRNTKKNTPEIFQNDLLNLINKIC